MGICLLSVFHHLSRHRAEHQGPHFRLTFLNPYERHIFFDSSNNIVLRHDHSSGMAKYKSYDLLIACPSSGVRGAINSDSIA